MQINIKNIIEKNIAISTEDGQKVLEAIKEAIDNGEKDITISFEGIDMLISHFLNESIGKLYKIYPKKWDFLDNNLKFIEIDEDDLLLLKNRVIPNFKNSDKRAKNIEKEILK